MSAEASAPKFYSIRSGAFAEQVAARALQIATLTWTEVLDCSKSIQRQISDKAPGEVLAMARGVRDAHWTLIFRDGFGTKPPYAELSCRVAPAGETADYFLWIVMTPADGRKLATEFSLSPV